MVDFRKKKHTIKRSTFKHETKIKLKFPFLSAYPNRGILRNPRLPWWSNPTCRPDGPERPPPSKVESNAGLNPSFSRRRSSRRRMTTSFDAPFRNNSSYSCSWSSRGDAKPTHGRNNLHTHDGEKKEERQGRLKVTRCNREDKRDEGR